MSAPADVHATSRPSVPVEIGPRAVNKQSSLSRLDRAERRRHSKVLKCIPLGFEKFGPTNFSFDLLCFNHRRAIFRQSSPRMRSRRSPFVVRSTWMTVGGPLGVNTSSGASQSTTCNACQPEPGHTKAPLRHTHLSSTHSWHID